MTIEQPASYTNLDIIVTAAADEMCSVTMESAAGGLRSTFESPVPLTRIVEVVEDLESSIVGSENRSRVRRSRAGTGDPVGLGKALYTNLFSEEARTLLEASLQDAKERGEGLRICLQVPAGSSPPIDLARLPWELMRADMRETPIALGRDLSIVRRVAQESEARSIATSIPLRVLVVMANPNDVAPLNLDTERARIESSWAHCPGVMVDFLDTATLGELKTALRKGQYNVLHYMGHADFDEDDGKGVLVLESEDGSSDLVDGTTLGRLLREEPALQLVFLNACETGQGSGPFPGVAAAMVDAGVPAVLAMQFAVSDAAAIVFSTHFYDAITAEHPVDGAVAIGRRGVVDQLNSLEWATPVLFMRSRDGFLFDFPVLYQHQP